MMNCNEVQSRIAEGPIDSSELMTVASHVLSCEVCAAFANELNQLTRTLRTPDDSIEAPAGGYDAFADRLAGRVATSRRGRLRWFVAAAAMVTLTAGAYWLGLQNRVQPLVSPVAVQTLDDRMTLTPVDVRRSRQTFNNVAEVFDQRAAWVMTSDRSADVGVVQDAVDPATPMVLLRLALVFRGETISSGDLAIFAGREARLSLPLEAGQRVGYRVQTYADQPGRLAISVELLDGNGASTRLAALSTQIDARPGQPARAGEIVTSAGEYEVMVGFANASETANP